MSSIAKKNMEQTLLKRSALIFLIKFPPIIASLVVAVIFSRLIPKSLNGIYQNAWVNMALLLGLACLGLPTFLFTHRVSKLHRWLKRLKSRHLAIYGAWVVGLAVLYKALLIKNADAFPAWVMIGLFLVQATIILTESYLIITEKYPALITASVLYAVGFIVVHIAFLREYVSFSELFQLVLLIAAARLFILGVTAVRNYRRHAVGITAGNMPHAIRTQWFQLGLYDMSQILFSRLDKMVVGFMVSPALFAVYFYGTMDIPFISPLLSAAGSGLMVQMNEGEHSHADRVSLVNYSGAALARIVFPIFFFLLAFRYELFEVLFSNKYLDSVPLFAISLLVLPLRAYNFTSVLQHMGKVRTVNAGAAIDLAIALALLYPLYLLMGMRGIVLSFIISTYIQCGFYLLHTARALHCSFFDLIPWNRWITMLILFGTIAIGLHYAAALFMSMGYTLLLGFCVTAIVIAIACVPLIRRRTHG